MRDNHSAAEKIKEISGTNPLKCMKCGKCSATCPSFDEMDIKPHQFVSYVINENIEALVNSASLWKCLSCFACVERCPRDVKPGKIIDGARQLVVREKGGDYLEGVYLFDLYQGKQVPQGFKSLAYSLQFRSEEGTLTDQDIEGPIKDIVEELKNTLHCELR